MPKPNRVPISYLVNVTDDRLTVRFFMLQEQATELRRNGGVDFTVNIPQHVFSEPEAARLWHHRGNTAEVEIVDQARLVIGEHVAPEWAGTMLTDLGACVLDGTCLSQPEETLYGFLVRIDGVAMPTVLPPRLLQDHYAFVERPTVPAISDLLAAVFKDEGVLGYLKVRIGGIATFFDAAIHITQPSASFPVVGTPIDGPGQFSNNSRFVSR